MATNRTRRTRQFKPTTISDALRTYLETGDYDRNAEGAKDVLVMRFDRKTKKEWDRVRDQIMVDWLIKHPGTRPWSWWEYDAEREPVDGWECPHFDSPQRQRIGGIGTPQFEVTCSWGGFSYGIPNSWITESLKRCGFRGEAIDPDDPPTFESEAAYLKRKGLLTQAEIKWLKEHPEALAPEVIED
jgi:hypothetical protein